MSAVSDIMNKLPIDQLAQQVGADPAQVQSTADNLIQSLLGGLSAESKDPSGEQQLASALLDHSQNSQVVDQSGSVNLQAVDPIDGDKIVQHVFGQDSDQVATQLTGAQSTLARKLLPILAPIVLAYIAKKLQSSNFGADQMRNAGGGGGLLGAILGGGGLGSILGGGAPAQQQAQPGYQDQQSGMSLGDLIGGMLGGQHAQTQQDSPLGGLLNSMFGR